MTNPHPFQNDIWVLKLMRRNIPRNVAVSVARTIARRVAELPAYQRAEYLRTVSTPAQIVGRVPPELKGEIPPAPPARFFYNRFWLRKFQSWGLSYVVAGLFAQHIAEKCYRQSPEKQAFILRQWNRPEILRRKIPLLRRLRRKFRKSV
ncbi:hypothetical protein [Rhizobium sp. UGM030330-04]|uniref:hypothetical protein n=1 Tax=Pseudomonadota TaxID=1224 RepID=UPI0011440D87|nr:MULTISPECIES: hypothetical protein [Pseudomonadota]